MQDEVRHGAINAYHDCGLRYVPNPMQKDVYETITSEDCTLLLKAPTGTGKMEAVVIPALSAGRRLFLIYPALSLIEDQEMRLEKLLQHLSTQVPSRPRALVVDTGAVMYRRSWLNGQEGKRQHRHLYHGDIILTTLDKFLYRFFGFGESKKNYIYPLRLRYGRQPLFCFDEAHSYDEIAYTNFVDLVRTLAYNTVSPSDVVVMTATMPPTYEQELTTLLTPLDYTSGEKAKALVEHYADSRPHPQKALTYNSVSIGNKEAFNQTIIDIVRSNHQPEKRTILTVETVEVALMLYKALRSSYDAVLLYHGRQSHPIRRQTYATLKSLEEQNKGYLLITTSAIEVGCDLDAHLLITQLCNPEQLVQRAGRCNRKAKMEDAQIIVVGDHIPDYLCTLATPEDIKEYLLALRQLAKQGFFEASLLITFRRKQTIADYRVQTMFTMLYEYVYEAERANKTLHDKGLVVTRSWEPTITLTTKCEERDGRWILHDELQISLLRCATKSPAQLDGRCKVFVRYYDESESRYKFEVPQRGGCAYHQDIIIQVPPEYVDAQMGYTQVPKLFLHGGGRQGYRRWLSAMVEKPASQKSKQIQGRVEENTTIQEKIWWWYLEKLPLLEEEIQTAQIGDDNATSENGEKA